MIRILDHLFPKRFIISNLAAFVWTLSVLSVSGAPPDPIVSVSVNDSRVSEIYRGMPMLVCVTVMHPSAFDSNAPPILLASPSGAWNLSLSVEVRDGQDVLQAWPFQTSLIPSNTISLDGMRFARIDQWLSPLQTSLLSTGQYYINVTLNTTNVTLPGAWRGLVESVPAEVTIADEPTPLSQAQTENKYSQLALYELFLSNGQAALVHINQLLALYPTNITGLRIKSMALDTLNRRGEAYVAVDQALAQAYARNPNRQEPPNNLLELQRQLEAKLIPAVLALVRTNQDVSLSWFGHPDFSYRLEASADLVAWSLVATNFTAVDNILSFDVPPSANRRFFRVMR